MAMKLERVERLNLTLSASAVAATFAFASPHVASSLAIGAALEAMNFGALLRGARIYLGGGEQGSGPWLALFSVRFVLLGAGIVFAMLAGAHPVALVCGLSIAIPTVLIDGWIHRPTFDPDAVDEPPEWVVPGPDDESWERYSIWRPMALDQEADALSDEETAHANTDGSNGEPVTSENDGESEAPSARQTDR
jgi:hypothetical protein